MTSVVRVTWLHLNPKISCQGIQFSAPATAEKSLISSMGTTLRMKEPESMYILFHGNVLYFHSAWKIIGLRILLETAYKTATFKSSREDVAFQAMSHGGVSGEWWLLALNLVLISAPDFQNVDAQNFLKPDLKKCPKLSIQQLGYEPSPDFENLIQVLPLPS